MKGFSYFVMMVGVALSLWAMQAGAATDCERITSQIDLCVKADEKGVKTIYYRHWLGNGYRKINVYVR